MDIHYPRCMPRPRRSFAQRVRDFAAFPLRAVSMFEEDRWGLTSLRSERFDFVASQVSGSCLDVGCGRHDTFVTEFLGGNGRGVDVFAYDGLRPDQILEDPTRFPFEDESFDCVTFIANLNHVPRQIRAVELAEAWRCVRPGGRIIVTMGNPLAELAVHQVIHLYDRVFGTNNDVDSERGMVEGETYYITPTEIRSLLENAGFHSIQRKSFWTQWWLNHMYIGRKGDSASVASAGPAVE